MERKKNLWHFWQIICDTPVVSSTSDDKTDDNVIITPLVIMSNSVVLRSAAGFQISSASPKGVVGNNVGFYEAQSPPKFMV